jgi:beta-glucanase (GH16 family)
MTAQLTFDDEFNSLSLYSSTTGKGTWDTTYFYNDGTSSKGSTLSSNGEQEWYINSDYAATSSVKPWSANGGVLTLQAAPASSAISSQINGYQYTSGMLNTYHSFSQTYGFFEMRAQLPSGQGLWPAFWLLPEDGSWPPELDIMEAIDKATTDYTTVHSNNIANTMSSKGTDAAGLSSGYHTYAVDWEPDHITWYLDGQEVYQVATPSDMNKPMYVILNLAVGGGWPGNADGSTQFPANYNVDWVRAYSSNPYSAGNPDSSDPAQIGGTSSTTDTSTSTTTAATSQPVTVSGATDGADSITGPDNQWNVIHGNGGNDSIVGGNGFNQINGNTGDDTIIGHSTTGDWLLGGQGQDSIDASASHGNNILNGNLGNDTLIGGAGADTLRGGQGDDVIHAGSGNDWISGDLGNNTIYGGQGADTFHAGGGHDVINGWHNGDHVHIDQGVTYTVAQVNGDVHITLSNGGEMDLIGVQQSSLQSGWII